VRSDIELDSLSDNDGAFRATDAQPLSARVFLWSDLKSSTCPGWV